MQTCDQCPANPSCNMCLQALGAGDQAKKVMPPRPIVLTHLATGETHTAELRAVSRRTLGVYVPKPWQSGRYEITLASDFKIVGSMGLSMRGQAYLIFDIEKVLRKNELFERLLMEEFHSWHMMHQEKRSDALDEDTWTAEWREQFKQELNKLNIIKHLDDVRMFVVHEGQIKPLGPFSLDENIEGPIKRMIERVSAGAGKHREQVFSTTSDQVHDVTVVSLEKQTCGIAVINITEVIAAERERRKEEWELYKSVLSIVTGNKLELASDEDLYQYILQSELISTICIKEAQDLAIVRQAIRSALSETELSEKRILNFTVAVNEAATNTIKHGTGGLAQIYICPKEEKCRIVIFDEGEGIQLTELPKAALMKGYSTTESMGVGFHVMLTYADRILINSSTQGTKIVLELHNIRLKASRAF